jgi:lipoprotein-anchoring transpeptidase ErfK/SrfK
MRKIALSFSVLLLTSGLSSGASAQNSRYVTPPPVVLSPNLTEAWMVQLQPGYRLPAQTVRYHVPEPVDPVAVLPAAPDPHGLTPDEFLPAVVEYDSGEKPGTIVIDTVSRHLYLVEEGGMARRYGVGVGKPGFEWAGTHNVTRKAEWPDWHPPAEMRQRRPNLPLMMAGGPNNPLGARALYLGSTLYRIHGTSEPWTIGHAVSSGCIRMRNEDVMDLYDRVPIGTKVIVM